MKNLNLFFICLIILLNQSLIGQTIYSSAPDSIATFGTNIAWWSSTGGAGFGTTLDSNDDQHVFTEVCASAESDTLFFGNFEFDAIDNLDNSIIYLNITKRKGQLDTISDIRDAYLVATYNGQIISGNLADTISVWPANDSTFTYIIDNSSLQLTSDLDMLNDSSFGFLFKTSPGDPWCMNAFINSVKLFVEEANGASVVADAGPDQSFNCSTSVVTLGGDSTSMGANFEYAWTDGSDFVLATEPFFETSQSGSYVLTVTNTMTNEMATDTVSVSATFEFIGLSVTGTGELTCESPTMTLNVFTELFYFKETSVLWETLDGNIISDPTQASIEISQGGVYTVVVTNLASGCTGIGTYAVDSNQDLPQISIAFPDVLNCENLSVLIDATVTGINSTGYTYIWYQTFDDFPYSIEEDILVTQPGEYTLTVTNPENGCTSQASVFVASDEASPELIISTPSLLSVGSTIQLDATGSTTGPAVAYVWSTSNGNIVSGANTLTPAVDEVGTYCLTVSNQDNGCEATDCVDVLLSTSSALVADAGPDQELTCDSFVKTIGSSNTSMGAEFSYTWTDGLGSIIGTTLFIDVSEPGVYTLTVTNNSTGQQSSDEVVITIDIVLVDIFIPAPDVLTCENKTVVLNLNINTSDLYAALWITAGGSIISDPTLDTITVDAPGIYYVVVTDLNNGCSSTASVDVISDTNIPMAIIDEPFILDCDGGITISTPNFAEDTVCVFSWLPQDGLTVDPDNPLMIWVELTGTYTLVKTDTLTSCTTHFLYDAIVGEEIIADAGPDLLITCASTLNSGLGGPNTTMGPNVTYSWSTADGVIFGDTDQATAIPAAPGTYTLSVTDLTTGCITTDEVLVTMGSFPQMEIFTTDVTCFGLEDGSVEIEVSGGVPPYSFVWTFAGFPQSDLAAGVYVVTVIDAEGCSVSQSFVIHEPAEVNVGFEITSEGSLTAVVTGGTPPYTYDWNVGGDSATIIDPIIGTEYTVTVTDAAGCTYEGQMLYESTAVQQNEIQQLLCYPNPTTDAVTIELKNIAAQLVRLEIIDIRGRSMTYTSTFANQNTMNLSLTEFTSGTYFINAIIDDQLFYQKLVVIK